MVKNELSTLNFIIIYKKTIYRYKKQKKKEIKSKEKLTENYNFIRKK